MKITKIKLINFRNYSKLQLKLDNHLNIFVGNNAQGKTNILESIYVLALTKSHRVGIENNLIKLDESKSIISGSVKKNNIINDLRIELLPDNKKVFFNETEIRKLSNYIGNLNVIMFCPDDLDLLKKAPSIRRNYLNIELSQLDTNYIKYLNEYNKLLKTKNEYLKSININDYKEDLYLDTINSELIERACKIFESRTKYIELINSKINYIYNKITKLDILKITYDYGLELNSLDVSNYKEVLSSKIRSNTRREIIQGMSLYGPHRDDFSFELDNIDLKFYGSQGQQRIAVIAFKLAEIEIFKEIKDDEPVLLLDDIFSEIDIRKRNQLLKYIDDNVQTIITTTDLKNINKKTVEKAKVFEVHDGNVLERS